MYFFFPALDSLKNHTRRKNLGRNIISSFLIFVIILDNGFHIEKMQDANITRYQFLRKTGEANNAVSLFSVTGNINGHDKFIDNSTHQNRLQYAQP